MAKFTPTTLTTLTNQQSAIATINTNLQNIATAMEKTLSRDGTSPNEMETSLDMNSRRIINLPEPQDLTEPMRLIDATTLNGGGTVVVADTVSVTLEQYGGVGDGVEDDAPAFRAAMSALNALGGGSLQLGPNTYLLASMVDSKFIELYSNIQIIGCGPASVLKVADNTNTLTQQFYVMMPNTSTDTAINNVLFKDFVIDFNGVNNGGFDYNNVGIGVYVGRGVHVDGVRFQNNPGSQNISFGLPASPAQLKDVTIARTYHINGGDVTNASCTDHSAIYCYAENYVVANNVCTLISQSTKNTAIEVGGTSGSISNNVTKFYSKGFNIVATTFNCDNLSVIGNTVKDARFGIHFWSTSPYVLSNIIVSGNTFQRSASPTGGGLGFIDYSGVNLVHSPNMVFSNNLLVNNSAAGEATTSVTDGALVLGSGVFTVANNIFVGFSGPAITNGTLDTSTGITIRGNTIKDCGKTNTAAYRRGVLISSAVAIKTFVMENNFASNTTTVYATTGFDVTLTNAAYGLIGPNNHTYNITTGTSFSLSGGFIAQTPAGVVYSRAAGQGYGTTAALTDGQLLVGSTGNAPEPRTISGDGTMSALGALTVTKINGVTPAAGFTTFMGTPSSANLRSLMTDESGSGALLFAGGNIGAATGTSLDLSGGAGSTTVANNVAYAAKDNGGTARGIMKLDTSNVLVFDTVNSASMHFRIAGSTYINMVPSVGLAVGFGIFSSHDTLGVGYAAGSGGAVTQITSRTTGVTLNKINGAITLFNAAGTTGAYTTFTVTNSTVAATDTVIVCVKSATNTYLVNVTAVAAGSFNITFISGSGTAADSPVFNFSVIKAVAS